MHMWYVNRLVCMVTFKLVKLVIDCLPHPSMQNTCNTACIKPLHAPPSLWQRWFINGEVPCFTGPHLPLALLAMAVLLVCFLLIPLTMIISLDILEVHTMYIVISLETL